jgi:transcriptional regulator with XRE-family HTH domain
MTLTEYLKEKQVPPGEFARAIRVTEVAVRRYLRGARIPSVDVMQRIASLTEGAVTANDFYQTAPRNADAASSRSA